MVATVLIPHVTSSHRGSVGWHVWGGMVRVICGGCGRDAGYLGNHTIFEDGRVTASLQCPNKIYGKVCTWHVMGKLEGWTHGKKEIGAVLAPECNDP